MEMGKTSVYRERSIASAVLLNLINNIEDQNKVDNPTLLSILKQSKLEESDFLQYNHFNHSHVESYGRCKVYEGENFSIYIMSWLHGDYTAIHSHGNCDWGAVYFFGDTSHRLYNTNGNKIELIEKGIVVKGTIASVTGKLVHSMGNQNETPILTLHIYGSNNGLSNANDDSLVYELEKKRVSITSGEAYLNLEPGRIKQSVQGISTDVETVSDYFNILLPYYRKNQQRKVVDFLEKVLQNPKIYFEDGL